MELKNINIDKTTQETQENENDTENIEELFNKPLEIGGYIFKLKKGIKGKDLFKLTNMVQFEDFESTKDGADVMQKTFNKFADNFEYVLSFIEYSIDNSTFLPLMVNGICQVSVVETNIIIMNSIFALIFEKISLFFSISQRQLQDTK